MWMPLSTIPFLARGLKFIFICLSIYFQGTYSRDSNTKYLGSVMQSRYKILNDYATTMILKRRNLQLLL